LLEKKTQKKSSLSRKPEKAANAKMSVPVDWKPERAVQAKIRGIQKSILVDWKFEKTVQAKVRD